MKNQKDIYIYMPLLKFSAKENKNADTKLLHAGI